MNQIIVIGLLVASSISMLHGAKFPSDVPKCKAGDVQCIKESTSLILTKYAKGLLGINLLSLDPIAIDKIDIVNGNQGPVNLKLFFNNAKLYGVKDAIITNVKGFTNDPTGMNELALTFPRLELISPYRMDGKVLILPVQGKGDSNLTLLNTESTIKFTGTPVTKNGKVYMQTADLKFALEPKQMIVQFGNMFNGDPLLGPSTNQFLNENWADIYRELQPSVEIAFGEVLRTLINNVFASLQYKNAFQPE